MSEGININLSKWFILLFIIVFSGVSNAQISMKAKIDSTNILIGDVVNLTLELKYKSDIKLLGSELVDSAKAFELLYLSDVDSTFKKGLVTKKQIFTFQTFKPGIQLIPSYRLYYQEKNDTTVKWISTDTFQVQVNAMEVDTSMGIKPIQEPLGVPLKLKDLKPLLYVIPVLLLVILLILYIEHKKRNIPLFAKRVKPKLPAHIIAITALRKLEEEKLWQKGDIKEFHSRLTDIIRIYIENRYDVPAIESTTDEIIADLITIEITDELRTELHSFLKLSDLVKFAKLIPQPNENEKCLQTSYSFVNQTKEKLRNAGEDENKRANLNFSV